MGIRDRYDEWAAAGLSCAHFVAEKVGELAGSEDYMKRFLQTSKVHYLRHSGKSEADLHGNFMRKQQMMQVIRNRKFLHLFNQAGPTESARLQSLRTPHATALSLCLLLGRLDQLVNWILRPKSAFRQYSGTIEY